MPLNFTLKYADRVSSIEDDEGDVADTPGVGKIFLKPAFPAGVRIPVLEYLPEPTGLGLRTFEGFLDTDGTLKKKEGGEGDLRVWANDPAWNLDRLQYQVSAQLTDLQGYPVPFYSFYFDAPKVDTVIYLVSEMPRPHQKFGRGRPGHGISSADLNEDGLLVLTREDGVELGPYAIPETNSLSAAYAMTFGR